MSAVTMGNDITHDGGPSALDYPLHVTFFKDASAHSKQDAEVSLRALIPRFQSTSAASKALLPWIKLATFGNQRTDRGSLRHDRNILSVHGIEADYDGETITVERARQIIASAGLAAVVYTSPSHTDAAPRWRILCPLAIPIGAEQRARMVARLNGLFVGALARESFTASQAYYYGFIQGATDHCVVAIDGRALDLADELDAQAVGRPERPTAQAQPIAPRPVSPSNHSVNSLRHSNEGTPYGLAALEDATTLILSAPDGAKFDTLNRQAFGIGQLVGAGELTQGPAINALRSALEGIRHRCEDFAHAEKGLRVAFEQGMAQPRQAPAPRLVRRIVEEYQPRPEPPPRDHAPDHWSAEPDPEPPAPEVERVAPDAPGTGLPLVYFQDVEPALAGDDFVEGLLVRAAMSVFYGPSNCGKTFFASDLALHIALGKPWNGREVDQGGVIYCALEGSHGIRNRVTAWAKHYGVEGAPLPFAIIPVALNLLNPEADTSRLIEAIQEAAAKMGQPVALVVMDTLSRAMAGGNENAPEDMGALVMNSDRIRQATGAHVAWIHHSGKDQAQGARGHSLLRAATDTEIEISRPDVNSPSTARVTKQRELEIDGVWTFSLERVELGKNHRGKPVTSCIVTPAETMAQEARASLTNGESMALRILHDVMASQPHQPPYQAAQAGVQVAATKHAWREAFFARSTADSHEAKKKAFNRAAEGLSQKGKIGVHHDLVWAV
jgi:hypothetical protein